MLLFACYRKNSAKLHADVAQPGLEPGIRSPLDRDATTRALCGDLLIDRRVDKKVSFGKHSHGAGGTQPVAANGVIRDGDVTLSVDRCRGMLAPSTASCHSAEASCAPARGRGTGEATA